MKTNLKLLRARKAIAKAVSLKYNNDPVIAAVMGKPSADFVYIGHTEQQIVDRLANTVSVHRGSFIANTDSKSKLHLVRSDNATAKELEAYFINMKEPTININGAALLPRKRTMHIERILTVDFSDILNGDWSSLKIIRRQPLCYIITRD